MRHWLIALTVTGAGLAVGPAYADGPMLAYTGHGSGSTHCQTYEMHVEMEVQADKVVGSFQQKGRTKYQFSLPKDADGKYAGAVKLSSGQPLNIKGTATTDGGTIAMDGYCKFSGKLAKK